jgi:hypothetical protein
LYNHIELTAEAILPDAPKDYVHLYKVQVTSYDNIKREGELICFYDENHVQLEPVVYDDSLVSKSELQFENYTHYPTDWCNDKVKSWKPLD